MRLTCVILTKNEEKNIEEVIRAVDFCDEIILIDDYSTDKTVEVIEKSKIKIFRHALNQDFAKQRNFGLSKATGDWVLFIDADERMTPLLRKEISKSTNKQISKFSAYLIRRKNLFMGSVVGEDRILRLAKRNAGKWERMVHEVWKVNGRIGTLSGYLRHNTADNLKEAVAKTNLYSTLHARQNAKDGKKSNLFKIIFFPKAKFLENILTGKGFVFAILHAFHSFLAWSKQWLQN